VIPACMLSLRLGYSRAGRLAVPSRLAPSMVGLQRDAYRLVPQTPYTLPAAPREDL